MPCQKTALKPKVGASVPGKRKTRGGKREKGAPPKGKDRIRNAIPSKRSGSPDGPDRKERRNGYHPPHKKKAKPQKFHLVPLTGKAQ